MSSTTFRKRTFSFPLLLESAAAGARALPTVARALIAPKTSGALREAVALSVTEVNDCRYCAWVHEGLAQFEGLDREALDRALGGNVANPDDARHAAAASYGRHFAAERRRPTEEAEAALARTFSPAEVAEIRAFVDAMYYANLSGNSADAWLARLRGQEVEHGHPVAEAVAAVVALPFLAGAVALSRLSTTRPPMRRT